MNITVDSYPHTMKPFEHQLDHIKRNYSKKAWGLLWEQGTAKTKPIIDTAFLLFYEKKINALVVIAPPGVERNWKSDEFPKHMPPEFGLDVMIEFWQTSQKHTKNHQRLMEALLRFDGLAVLLMSYPAMMTKEGKAFLNKFLEKRKCLYVLDEAHNIKSPGAKTTMTARATGKKGTYRRILTGTPIAQGPFDIYSQICFIDEWFWKNKGIHGATEFRQEFGVFEMREEVKRTKGYDPGYDKLLGYKNIDKLKEWLKEIADRYEKSEVLSFLPPKLYSKRYFDMSKEQKAAYEELESTLILELGEYVVTAELPIVKLLRLQQISCNYVPVDDDEPVHMFSSKNPRIGVLEDLRDSIYQPTIVWARFRHDVDQIMDLLGTGAVRYDGSISDDEAELSKKKFQAGDAQWFVGTAQKGGPGLTLTQAKNMIYYSNSFKLIDRLQSEDRAHRAGMDHNPLNIIDIVANDSRDMDIVENLRNKRKIAREVQGDVEMDWI